MLQPAKEFKIGRPQIFAGLMLLAFLAQCLWAAGSRPLSELETVYIACGLGRQQPEPGTTSPMTAQAAALPARAMLAAGRRSGPIAAALAVPRPWLIRLPFIIFGVWLGGALWWVSRRLFSDSGGYVALGLYCSSPATVMISSNIGPEIILAWSIFGMIYTAIGVAHTLYAPPRKWAARIVVLGLAMGFAVSTTLWSGVIVLLALAFMLYLAPGRRRAVVVVITSAMVIALAVLGFFYWTSGTPLKAGWVPARPTLDLLRNLNFVFADDYALVALLIASLTVYGSWKRTRYFGNTAPLLTAFAVVLVFALAPSLRVWKGVLGLPFIFVFAGGVMADLLETSFRRVLVYILGAGFVLRIVLGLRTVWFYWIGQKGM
jgi:hypothetical protein